MARSHSSRCSQFGTDIYKRKRRRHVYTYARKRTGTLGTSSILKYMKWEQAENNTRNQGTSRLQSSVPPFQPASLAFAIAFPPESAERASDSVLVGLRPKRLRLVETARQNLRNGNTRPVFTPACDHFFPGNAAAEEQADRFEGDFGDVRGPRRARDENQATGFYS